MVTSMLTSKYLIKRFWAEPISTTCYVSNHVYRRPRTNRTSYELWSRKKPTIKYFRVFGSTCYVFSDREHLEKFDKKSDGAIFLGYFTSSRAYPVYNKKTLTMEEFINVAVDDHEST